MRGITTRRVNKNSVCIVLLVLLVMFGNSIRLGEFRIFGVVPTAYRVGIPLLTLHCIYRQFKLRAAHLSQTYWLFAGMMLFWLLYGCAGLALSPYADGREGLKELLCLPYGLCSVYCLCVYCQDKESVVRVFHTLRACCVAMCLFALFEIVTDVHLATSKLYNPATASGWMAAMLNGIKTGRLYNATCIYFGINDFSVVLGILLPTQYIALGQRAKGTLWNALCFVLALFILAVNDATIVLIAVCAGLLVYACLEHKARARNLCMISGMVLMQTVGAQWMYQGLVQMKRLAASKAFLTVSAPAQAASPTVPAVSSVARSVSAQVATASAQNGSLFERLSIYLDTLELTAETGGLGIGPAGFMPYFQSHPHRSSLVNPHNWWLEVLSQYGVLVFAAYAGILVWLYIRVIKLYLAIRERLLAVLIAMCTTFVIACISPSSFMGYSYQWLLPGLCIVMLRCYALPNGTTEA